MIGQFLTLVIVLFVGLIGWSAYERTTWDEDYTRYPITVMPLGPLDTTFEQHIQPTYFKQAIVISNETHLRFPEDIEVNSKGVIYTGLLDGSIVSVIPGSNNTELIFKGENTGRVLGLSITADDSTLFFLTEDKGLVKLNLNTREATFLFSEFEGKKVGILNAVCIDEERQILYITQSGPIRIGFAFKEVLLGHEAGRIYSYDLKTGKVTLLLDKIAFANGIVFQKETNSIIFAELTRFRIWRYRLAEGQKEVLVDNLFGFADNLKLNDQGQLLIGLPNTRTSMTDLLMQYPLARKISMFIPERVHFAINPKRAGGIRVDTKTGKILEYMFGAPTKTAYVTTILEKNGKTYFASLKSPTIVVFDSNGVKEASKSQKKGEEL